MAAGSQSKIVKGKYPKIPPGIKRDVEGRKRYFVAYRYFDTSRIPIKTQRDLQIPIR